MPKLRYALQKNKNILFSLSLCVLAVLITLFILNTLLGLLIFYTDATQSIFWHHLSAPLLLLLMLIMVSSIAYELYLLRQGGHSFAHNLGARRICSAPSIVPEEALILRLTEDLAQQLMIPAPAIYVLDRELGINALSVGLKTQNTVLIVTWGALQNLDEPELYGLLTHEFYRMLCGEVVENTQLKVLYGSLTRFSQCGTELMQRGFHQHHQNKMKPWGSLSVALGSSLWLIGALGVFVSRAMKCFTLGDRTEYNDLKTKALSENHNNIQALLRIHVHHYGSQIYSPDAEAISHMCFANALQQICWMNVHPSIEQRLYALDPSLVEELQLENLKKLGREPLFLLFHSLEENFGVWKNPWLSPEPLPLLRLSPISFAIKDAIRPLNPEVREKISRPEIIQRALQTATGAREVVVAILMIRQYREFIPQESQVSQAIIDALLHLDGRVHLSIFKEASQNMGKIPMGMARQFLTKLAKICQADGEIGLLDALLLERVKSELDVLPMRTPSALKDVKPQIVRLIDALLHVQQINSQNQFEARRRILSYFLDADEMLLYEEISDEPIDLGEILHEVSGLLLRERFSVLSLAEMCLWHDWVITQDELDVLQLLYWRLGFSTTEIVEQMHKKNSIVII